MRLSYIAAPLAALLLLAGCGSAPAPSPEPAAAGPVTAPSSLPEGMGSRDADGVFPRTVTHFGGTTTIPAAPRRIVAVATGQLDGLLALDVMPVGTARASGAQLVPAYLPAAFPQRAAELGALTDVGSRTAPQPESIAAAKPDLILANKASSEKLYPQLSAIAPTVLTEGTGVNWKQDLLLLGAALGRSGAAQGLIDDEVRRAQDLGRRAGPVTVSLLRIQPDRVRIFGVPSFVGSIAADAGLPRPPSQQFAKTSRDIGPEELAQADAQYLFYGEQKAKPGAPLPELLRTGLGPSLRAVRDKHAVAVDDDVWYLNAGPVAARRVLDDMAKALPGG
ncbi:ABC transporter substrate-binding protein [Pseudonocardia phyllosphaerae]|uniref:ABC transporter substrate-binding protein n=1 Tax=Pseudonocardia phyllosphaerae TaxID=3390502 RepID=UPI00397A4D59